MPRKIATKSLLAAALLGAGSSGAIAAAPALASSSLTPEGGGVSAPPAQPAPAEGQPRPRRRHHHRHHRRHRVVASFNGTALATWFGPGFFGNHTACGQVLSHRLVGVANRTLPCGTLVRVSYEGRHVVVPVVDRGPYGPIHASWDLTEHAARLLKITETVKIHTRIVGHVRNSPNLGLPAHSAPQPAATPVSEEEEPAPSPTGGVVAAA